MMDFYLSTIDPNAGTLARENGLGIEIAEFCTAANMDDGFSEYDTLVRQEIASVSKRIFHGPFNELFPCAIDPLARKLAAYRYGQALELAQSYGASKLVLHGGFTPKLYYPCWYTEQSALFWKAFLREHPGDFEICLENVLEPEPEMLLSIVREVNDPRLTLCLDVGHVNAYSPIPAADWITRWGSCLSHAHIHNNDTTADTHSSLDAGTLDIAALLKMLPNTATATLELPKIGENIRWLQSKGFLKSTISAF